MSAKAKGLLSSGALAQIQAKIRFADIRNHPSINNTAQAPASAPSDRPDSFAFAPAHLGAALLAAYDVVDSCPELWALEAWVEAVRARHGDRPPPIDFDLSNGIALLRVMALVDPSVFLGGFAGGAAAPPNTLPPFPVQPLLSAQGQSRNSHGDVSHTRGRDSHRPIGDLNAGGAETELDEFGVVAKRNIHRLCRALDRFPWCDIRTKQPLPSIDFAAVDPWALGGFVLLAAVTGPDAAIHMREIRSLSEDHCSLLLELIRKAVSVLRDALPEADRQDIDRAPALATSYDQADTCPLQEEISPSVGVERPTTELVKQFPASGEVDPREVHVFEVHDVQVPKHEDVYTTVLYEELKANPAERPSKNEPELISNRETGPLSPTRMIVGSEDASREPETGEEWRAHAMKLMADLENARQRTREWEEHAASLQRLAMELSDKLRISEKEVERLRSVRDEKAATEEASDIGSASLAFSCRMSSVAEQEADGGQSRGSLRGDVSSCTKAGEHCMDDVAGLRLRVLECEKKNVRLERELVHARRELERMKRMTHGRVPTAGSPVGRSTPSRGLPR